MIVPTLADARDARKDDAKSPSEAKLRDHLNAILTSSTFEKSDTLRTLLSYLFEHRGQSISEYALATEALGKRHDFEPKVDASVRVRISRLRQKLEEFYQANGVEFSVRFSIPLGGHDLCITELAPPKTQITPVKAPKLLIWSMAGVIVVLTALYFQTLLKLRELQLPIAARADKPEMLPEFWKAFFSNGKPASLFVSTPVFFSRPKAETGTTTSVVIRDTGVNDFSDRNSSEALKWFSEKFGTLTLLENYTVASDTFAALQLAHYLQAKNVQLSVGGTAEMSVESAGDQNIVLIGTAGTSHQVAELLENAPFYVAPGGTLTVRNRNPRPGEPRSFETVKESSLRWVTPGLIAVLPGRISGTRVLVLTGFYTYPLVYALSTPSALSAIHADYNRAGRPTFFEAVINSEVESKGASVLRSSVVAFRGIEPREPAVGK